MDVRCGSLCLFQFVVCCVVLFCVVTVRVGLFYLLVCLFRSFSRWFVRLLCFCFVYTLLLFNLGLCLFAVGGFQIAGGEYVPLPSCMCFLTV